jgi:large subunit ribosomal protein L5
MSRLQEQYKSEILKNLYSKLNCNNIHEVPKISKIVLNIGLGEAKDDTKIIDKAQEELSLIAGQKAVKTKAKKAIAGFKIREGMPLGVSVTLRNKIMYEFLDRLINIAIPRIRDFRGLNPNCFDGRGNCTIGIKEQVIFPEIDYNSIDRLRGLQVIICTSANSDVEGIRFLELLGMPFVKNNG